MIKFHVNEDVYPYVRMTRRSKYVEQRALAYQAWMARFRTALHELLMFRKLERLMVKKPMWIKITILEQKKVRHNRDLDNCVKAVIDACQGVLFHNDFWFDEITARRVQSAAGPCVVVEMGYLDEQ